jgi:hypothetical protein
MTTTLEKYCKLPFTDTELETEAITRSTQEVQTKGWPRKMIEEAIREGKLGFLYKLIENKVIKMKELYYYAEMASYTPLGSCVNSSLSLDSLKCFRLLLLHGSDIHDKARIASNDKYESLIVVLLDRMRDYIRNSEISLHMLTVIVKALGPENLGNEDANTDATTGYSILETAVRLNSETGLLAVEILLEGGCKAKTQRGALCEALKYTTNTNLCMKICQLLLKADPSIVNEHPKYVFIDDENVCKSTPLVAAVSRTGDDCLSLTHMLLDMAHVNPNICVWLTQYRRAMERGLVSLLRGFAC